MRTRKQAFLIVKKNDLAKLLEGQQIIHATPRLTNIKVMEQTVVPPSADEVSLLIEADELTELLDRDLPSKLKFEPIIASR